MVIAPDLFFPVLFFDTEYFTVPFPVRLPPDVMVIHETLLLAVHAQLLDDAVTLTLPLLRALLKVEEVGEIPKIQVDAVNVAVTVFAMFMLAMVQVAFAAVPPVESQAPDHAEDDPLAACAVSVTAVPKLTAAKPWLAAG